MSARSAKREGWWCPSSPKFLPIFCVGTFSILSPNYLGERNKQGLLEIGNDPLRDIRNQKWSIEREFKDIKSQCCPSCPFTIRGGCKIVGASWSLIDVTVSFSFILLQTYLFIFKGVFPVLLHVYHSLQGTSNF